MNFLISYEILIPFSVHNFHDFFQPLPGTDILDGDPLGMLNISNKVFKAFCVQSIDRLILDLKPLLLPAPTLTLYSK